MYVILASLYNAVLLAVGLFALVRGAGPEKAGATINLAASFGTALLIVSGLSHWGPARITTWLVDLLVVAGFFLLSIRSDRFWPIWCFGFSLSDLFLHVAALILPPMHFPYESGQVLYAYLALAALAIGTARLSSEERGVSSAGWRNERGA